MIALLLLLTLSVCACICDVCQVRNTLEALEADETTKRAVRYCGALPRALLHRAMAHASIVLNTSVSEVGQLTSLDEP